MNNSDRLPKLSEWPKLEAQTFDQLVADLTTDPTVQDQRTEDLCQLDPRDGAMVIYAEHRAKRQDEHRHSPLDGRKLGCPICSGDLTLVVDSTPLSEGFSFISQNKFPMLYPTSHRPEQTTLKPIYPDPNHFGRSAFGFHVLQWTSSIHENDWHNMPIDDLVTIVQRLAVLEKKALFESGEYMPISDPSTGARGYFTVIKNYGPDAGASLTHGHQQIAYSNIMPRRTFNNAQFFERNQVTFCDYLLHDNPDYLTIAQEGSAKIVVPYYMRRPFNTLILMETKAQHLSDLSPESLIDLTRATQKLMQTFHQLLPELGKSVSFNMALHSGPNCQLYLEFFPIVQPIGGFERMGLWICQLTAASAANKLKELYQSL